MKRITALLLMLCLLLCACGTPPESTPSATEVPIKIPPLPGADLPIAAPTEAPVVYRHPLTGEVLDSLFTGRPAAIVIDNISVAMPQAGISAADMFYEIESESGITRCLAIFTDFESVQAIGPIRAARTYFNNIATSYDIPLFHCGGTTMAKAAQYDASGATIDNWIHVDQQFNRDYFYRDQWRLNIGYAQEHTLYIAGSSVLQCMADKGFNITYEGGTNYGLLFAEEPGIAGSTANRVTVSFLGGKQTFFTYNAVSGLYNTVQYDNAWVDANNNQTLAFRNVLALYAPHMKAPDGASFYTLLGSGTGYYACDGQIVKINWHRDNLYGPFSYTLEDGTPLTLGVGKTYIGIASDTCNIAYE